MDPAAAWSATSGQPSATWNYYQPPPPVPTAADIPAPPPPTSYYDPATTNNPAAPGQYGNYYYNNNNNYQQPGGDTSAAPPAYQNNTGATYTSFPNAGPQSYSATYYNHADHQTAYNNQTNTWSNAGYAAYPGQNTAVAAPATVTYQPQQQQQQYDHWGYYQTPAPAPAPVTAGQTYPVQGGSGGYQYPSNQPPPPGTTAWRGESGASVLPSLQVSNDAAPQTQNSGWDAGAQGFQNPQSYQLPSYFNKPLDTNPPQNYENQQTTIYSQGLSSQLSSTNQVSENLQPPLQTVMTLDTRAVNKMQIPTNPRIASSSVLGMPTTDKESPATPAAIKPAYISISVPKLNEVPSHVNADSMDKPGSLPPSLGAYVERTFARCKDDAQRAINRNKMMEITKKSAADGSLYTTNWDIEPLFPLSNTTYEKADCNLQSSITSSTLPKLKRSPSRRTKSRWEPIAEDKLAERLKSANCDSTKVVTWDHLKGADKGVNSKKYEIKVNWNTVKFVPSQLQTAASNIGQRPIKKPRFSEASSMTENGDASSGSDKEQNLTKYYASAITLANTPEERKRREHRSKRFEKVQESQSANKHPRPKIVGAGNIYIRRTNGIVPAKDEVDFSRAVEDIDWDALIVRGTCQEIEKRYLRLTAAPDPATVRPEEILEKALQMVHNSQKNYLYKCDQLKSIRQDLTVQHIQNELTAKVYETHARLALEAGDLPEYNQCQSQLTRLYADGIKGSHMEFAAYNLLCVILHSDNKRDLLSSMSRLSVEAKEDDAVKHALAVRSAVSSGNYILFFRLYEAAPNLSTCLMDLYVEKMRFEAVKCISKSYRPTTPITYIARVLGFLRAVQTGDGQGESRDGLEDCKEWLRSHGAVLVADSNGELQLDAKASSSSLFMPEPEDAVAHGDATLGLDDFMTRAS